MDFSYSQFQAMDLRIGKILSVEDILGADKLYKILVDVGTNQTTLVAGIKPFYTRESLIGQKVAVLVNLEPKTIRGVESRGMILAAVSEDRKEVVLIMPEKDLPEGSIIK